MNIVGCRTHYHVPGGSISIFRSAGFELKNGSFCLCSPNVQHLTVIG